MYRKGIFVTKGAGFIGSNFVQTWLANKLGHVQRYAIDATKIKAQLQWRQLVKKFETGMQT